jgi:hypothetical protein
MTVVRRFIAGSGTTRGPRPGGTPEYRRPCPSRGFAFGRGIWGQVGYRDISAGRVKNLRIDGTFDLSPKWRGELTLVYPRFIQGNPIPIRLIRF